MAIDSLHRLYVDELKDLHSAERQILDALPKMAKASSHEKLRDAFEEHRQETEGHVERLNSILENLGESTDGKTCQAMKGILSEGEEMLRSTEEGAVRDAAMISAAQRVEHYEMAGYGTVRRFAQMMGSEDAVRLLDQTLQEEAAADGKLTRVAEEVNPQAEA